MFNLVSIRIALQPKAPIRYLGTIAFLVAVVGGPALATPADRPAGAMLALHAQDETVARIGYGLAVGSAPLCHGSGWATGVSVQMLSQYWPSSATRRAMRCTLATIRRSRR